MATAPELSSMTGTRVENSPSSPRAEHTAEISSMSPFSIRSSDRLMLSTFTAALASAVPMANPSGVHSIVIAERRYI